MDKTLTQRINRSLVTCEHGIMSSDSCWWCQSTKNKPIEDRMDKMEERFNALLKVVKLLSCAPRLAGSGYGNTTIIQNIIEDSSLIDSGLEADKPDVTKLAFYMATDSDKIYQRRDNSWVDISYSRPTAPDVQITDISVDGSTGALQVTTP